MQLIKRRLRGLGCDLTEVGCRELAMMVSKEIE